MSGNQSHVRDVETKLKHLRDTTVPHVMQVKIRDAKLVTGILEILGHRAFVYIEDQLILAALPKDNLK